MVQITDLEMTSLVMKFSVNAAEDVCSNNIRAGLFMMEKSSL